MTADELTLRDRFAMAALATLKPSKGGSVGQWSHLLATEAYEIAGSMMVIRTAIMLGETDGAKFGREMSIEDAIEWWGGREDGDAPHDAAFDAAGDHGYGPSDDDELPGTAEYLATFDATAYAIASDRARDAKRETDRLNARTLPEGAS